jgi:hypothetical protein
VWGKVIVGTESNQGVCFIVIYWCVVWLSVTNSKNSNGKMIVGTDSKQRMSVIVNYWFFVVLCVTNSKNNNAHVTSHSGAFLLQLVLWKPISITYSERVLVALVVQHAMRMHHTVIGGLPHSTTSFHFIS